MKVFAKDVDSDTNTLLKVNHVTKKFGQLVAVNNLSFTVEKGQANQRNNL